MKTFSFTKKKGQWYVTLPLSLKEFNQSEFACVEEKGGALDSVAHGKSKLSLKIDTRPMKHAAVLELEDGVQNNHDGGLYCLRNTRGRLVKQHLGLENLSLMMFGELPERIYLRKK